MTLKEFANVDSFYRDLDNGNELEWRDYMARIISKLGIENIKPYIPYNITFLKDSISNGDVHFNDTTKLKYWDSAAERINPLLQHNGITCYSLSERVCILKETARILCEREMIK